MKALPSRTGNVISLIAILGAFTLLIVKNITAVTQLLSDGGSVISSTEISRAPPQDGANQYATAITSRNLFGTFAAAPVPIPQVLPETNLRLTLRGVAASSDESQSRAMIEGPDGKVSNYSAGSEIPGGALVNAIHKDRVILEYAGRLETLLFPELKGSSPNPPSIAPFPSISTSSQSANQTAPPRRAQETPAERDARIRAQLDQRRSIQNQLSIRERLNQLRSNSSDQ